MPKKTTSKVKKFYITDREIKSINAAQDSISHEYHKIYHTLDKAKNDIANARLNIEDDIMQNDIDLYVYEVTVTPVLKAERTTKLVEMK